ncbi:hypothetical protein D3C75_644790 [compost metagenome]
MNGEVRHQANAALADTDRNEVIFLEVLFVDPQHMLFLVAAKQAQQMAAGHHLHGEQLRVDVHERDPGGDGIQAALD